MAGFLDKQIIVFAGFAACLKSLPLLDLVAACRILCSAARLEEWRGTKPRAIIPVSIRRKKKNRF